MNVEKAEEVPGGVDKGVESVGVKGSVVTTLGTLGFKFRCRWLQLIVLLRKCKVKLAKSYWKFSCWHDSTSSTMNDWNRTTPVSLP